jgi:hypothetical protein
MAKSFRTAFCEQFNCSPDEFEETLFWKSLNFHAKLLAPLLWKWRGTFFKEDFELVREVAAISCRETFVTELNRFHGRNMRDKNWLRRTFGIRISAGKLNKLNKQLLV